MSFTKNVSTDATGGTHKTYAGHDDHLKVHGEGKLGNQDNDPEQRVPVAVPENYKASRHQKVLLWHTLIHSELHVAHVQKPLAFEEHIII